MQNQNIQQSFTETNVQANNITDIHFAMNRQTYDQWISRSYKKY